MAHNSASDRDSSKPPSVVEKSVSPEPAGVTFTATQAAYMREKRDVYASASKKERKGLVRKVAEHLAMEVERHSGKPLVSEAKKKLRNVGVSTVRSGHR
jgi:hypothetical protein